MKLNEKLKEIPVGCSFENFANRFVNIIEEVEKAERTEEVDIIKAELLLLLDVIIILDEQANITKYVHFGKESEFEPLKGQELKRAFTEDLNSIEALKIDKSITLSRTYDNKYYVIETEEVYLVFQNMTKMNITFVPLGIKGEA